MLKNHIVFALRIFWKEKVYSILNILGLTLGISVGIILLLYLQNELTYDTHNEKADQVYRITHYLKAQGADFNTGYTARELAPVLKDEFPEVLNYTRFNEWGDVLISVNLNKDVPDRYYEDQIVETDSSYLSLFTHDILEGDPSTCLVGPDKVVLTESIAKKYFGNKSAVGEIIQVGTENKRTVTAVISDLPHNSHLKYNILLSELPPRSWLQEQTDPERISEGYWNPGVYTYLLLPKGYDVSGFNDKFQNIFEKYFRPFADRIEGTATASLQPITDIHYNSTVADDEVTGDKNYLYTFTTIGIFLILLACINYMNLATARSVYRAGEMGVRKVLGYTRTQLFGSVLLEAFVLAVLAMILSIVLCYVVLNFTSFNSWIDKELTLNLFGNPTLTIGIILITVIVALVSGIYPALYIPAIPVVTALKGSYVGQSKGILLRKVLIVLQFVISLFVIVTTVLMDRQISFMQEVDLGFDSDNVILVDVRLDDANSKMDAIRARIKQDPGVISAATSWGVPGRGTGGQVFMVEKDGEMFQQNMRAIYAGKDYLETIGFEILEGRAFRKEKQDVGKYIIVNESGAKELGWGDEALNKKVTYFHGEQEMHIVGVVKDFNFQSLHESIQPLFIVPMEDEGGTLQIRVNGANLQQTISHIESVMTEFDPVHPFEYQFLDDEFERQYRADQIQNQLLSTLSYICIFISILGLIGLSAFTVSQKAKEISIRKTLGASVANVMVQFSKGYLKLMLVAAVIAIPIADYVIMDWLEEFAYQMPQDWWYYIMPSILVLMIGLVTVSVLVIRAAKANPVNGLRSE